MVTESFAIVGLDAIARQADNDAQLVELWLHGRSPHTQRAYRANAQRLFAFIGKPLANLSLRDLQAFRDSLTGLVPASQAQTLAAAKSLLGFARKIGYLTFNVGAALQLPKSKNTLAERILQESEVHQMFMLESNPRNKLILKTLYYAGVHVSELCGLRCKDLQARGKEGQMTVFGKGGTRAVLLPMRLWNELLGFRANADEDDPVFQSRAKRGHPLDQSQVFRIVRSASA